MAVIKEFNGMSGRVASYSFYKGIEETFIHITKIFGSYGY